MTAERPSPVWLYAFLAVQCASVAALTVEALGSLRIVLRVLPFGMSLAYLACLPAGGPRYPLRLWATAGLAVMSLGLLHPEANTLLAGVAQIALTLAVWGPVYWVGRIAVTGDVVRRVMLLVWAFNTLSAAVGVLQVYDPARFAPDPAFVRQLGGSDAEDLKIRLDDGTEVFRPMGLSDSPGGAALAANAAVVMGIGVALAYRSAVLKAAVAAGAGVAMFCLYLCQVRSLLILTAISVLCMLVLVSVRGRARAALYIGLVAVAGPVIGYGWATAVGQSAVVGRLETLWEGSPAEVYYSNRGVFVEDTLDRILPTYPFGAGLGRWGMMSYYFGDPNRRDSPPLWAEMTLTGWVYDGGLLLVLLGYGAMIVALGFALRVAVTHSSPLHANAAAVVAAVSAAAFATTISAHVFVAQSGMMYLLLNALLYAAVRDRASTRPAVGGR